MANKILKLGIPKGSMQESTFAVEAIQRIQHGRFEENI